MPFSTFQLPSRCFTRYPLLLSPNPPPPCASRDREMKRPKYPPAPGVGPTTRRLLLITPVFPLNYARAPTCFSTAGEGFFLAFGPKKTLFSQIVHQIYNYNFDHIPTTQLPYQRYVSKREVK